MANTQPVNHMWNLSFIEGRRPVDLQKLEAAIKKTIRAHGGHEPDIEVCDPEYLDPLDINKW